MKRCVLMLTFASVALPGQDQPRLFLRKADPAWSQGLKQKLFDWPVAKTQQNLLAQPNQAHAQKPFAWRLTNTQPDTFRFGDAEPVPATCVVPLLVVPVDPNVDSRMVRKVPKSKVDEVAVIQGMPTCPDRR